MSDAQHLLAQLSSLGVRLEADGGALRVNAPRGVLNEDLKQALAAQKFALLALLDTIPAGSIKPAPEGSVIPLTDGQQRLWDLCQLRQDAGVYNVPMVFRLEGEVNVATLESSLNTIQRRHSILRTHLENTGDFVHQIVSETAQLAFETVDLKDLGHADQRAAVDVRLEAEVQRPFDLRSAPLWRCVLLMLSDQESVLIFTMHHIVFDLSSKTLFLGELEALYGGGTLPELDIAFRDYAFRQQSAAQQSQVRRQLDHWKSIYSQPVRELLLPTDRPRTTSTSNNGRCVTFSLPTELPGELKQIGRDTKNSLFIVLLTAFHALLHRYTGQTDQIVCSPAACRNSIEVEPLIGYFNNILPIRTDLTGDPTFRELLGRVRKATLDGIRHQEAQFQMIAELPSIARIPLTRAIFNYRGEDSTSLKLGSTKATLIESRRTQADFDLALYMGLENGLLRGVLDYNGDLFEASTAEMLLKNFSGLLTVLVREPDQPLSALPILRQTFPDIEEILSRHPKIDEAVVVSRSDATGSSRVAYLVLNEDDIPSQEELRQHIDRRRPDDHSSIVFVPLDQIRQLPDGQVDLEALPAPLFSRFDRDYDYVEPRTELEKKLADVWQKVLWSDQPIGIHDDFFDLGGHSLLSVQLIAEVEKSLGRSVPLAEIGQLSTIARFAEILEKPAVSESAPTQGGLDDDILKQLQSYTSAWDGKRTRPNSLIVGLNTEGYRTPVFWVVQRYLNLSLIADHLDPEQPIYGLRSGHNVMGYGPKDIKTLAHYYVAEILEIQKNGPFIIGGICQAAEIAFAIAEHLLELGNEIELLVLQERFIAKEYSGRVAFLFGANSDRNPYYHFSSPELGWSKYYTGAVDVRVITGQHGTYFQQANIISLTDEIKSALENARTQAPGLEHGPVTLQRLRPDAYSAELTLLTMSKVDDEHLRFTIRVRNVSAETWYASERSGVYLGARWVNPAGRGAKGHDRFVHSTRARTAIPSDLKPGQNIELTLVAPVPKKPLHNLVEIDLVDEGISWFSDAGSQPIQIEIQNT